MLLFTVKGLSFNNSLEAQNYAISTGSTITVTNGKDRHPKFISHKLPANTLTLDKFQKLTIAMAVRNQLKLLALPEKPKALSSLNDENLYKFLCGEVKNQSLEIAEYIEKVNSQKVDIVFNPTRRSSGSYKLSPLFASQFCKKIKIDV